ncbi:transporter substrate-binding domain-containing protein [Bradyrhizobium cenepequi]|uniref:transporter substrate-binding domain-containing protein n=1 Tax=Bradyrhizobium cenepequi TaxID=2821403 RepID=UPI001CE39FF0|nr:transporter substrate-binding domain-containing protein [Bradyrhizobium cenepequi]MCA6113057.1 transporter substrate-binding domain-containing protein [Bradyrhizobium cenepequi]
MATNFERATASNYFVKSSPAQGILEENINSVLVSISPKLVLAHLEGSVRQIYQSKLILTGGDVMRATRKFSLLVLLLTLTGYSFPAFAQDESPLLASVRKTGKISVALASLPPYMNVSPNGEATGSSVDLQNMVLKGMGLPALTPRLTGWESLIPGLQAGQFDYVGAGVNITEVRCKLVVFSAPYYAAQTGLYVLPGNPKHLTSLADVARRPDIKVAATPGLDGYQGYALKQGVKPEQISVVTDIQAGAAMVTGGRVDAFFLGQFSIPIPKKVGLEVVVDEQSPVIASAAVFRKEDVRFRDAFNEQLVPLIRSGTIQKLYEKYGIPNGDALAKLLAKITKANDVEPSCE